MSQRKKANTNGGRVTTRELYEAVTGIGERIDGLSTRVDGTNTRMDEQATALADLHNAMHDLRKTTNERLHLMEADILTIRRPLALLTHTWTKVAALSAAIGTVAATLAQLEAWRFIPGL